MARRQPAASPDRPRKVIYANVTDAPAQPAAAPEPARPAAPPPRQPRPDSGRAPLRVGQQVPGLGQGGQHVLAAELMLFVAIVGMRAVAQYGPGDKKDIPPDQFGPLFILGNGFAIFFVLSFLAARGGTAAKVAGAAGLVIDIALLMQSLPHLEIIATEYEKPRKYKPLDETGSYAGAEADVLPPALQFEDTNRKLPPTPKGKSPRAAMKYARSLLKHYGWGPSQFAPLVKLWTQESGWNFKAVNPSSGALGIPQALGHTLPSGYKDSMAVQIRWGLQYIKGRYGSPAAAWAHEQHFNWY